MLDFFTGAPGYDSPTAIRWQCEFPIFFSKSTHSLGSTLLGNLNIDMLLFRTLQVAPQGTYYPTILSLFWILIGRAWKHFYGKPEAAQRR